jgi:hypothetical protein
LSWRPIFHKEVEFCYLDIVILQIFILWHVILLSIILQIAMTPIFFKEKVNFYSSRVPLFWYCHFAYCYFVTCHSVTCHSVKHYSSDCHGAPYFIRKKSILISAEYHYLDIDISHIVIFHIVILWHGILWHVILLSIILLIVMAPHISQGKNQFWAVCCYLDIVILHIVILWHVILLSIILQIAMAPHISQVKCQSWSQQCAIILIFVILHIVILWLVILWHVILRHGILLSTILQIVMAPHISPRKSQFWSQQPPHHKFNFDLIRPQTGKQLITLSWNILRAMLWNFCPCNLQYIGRLANQQSGKFGRVVKWVKCKNVKLKKFASLLAWQ